MKEEKQVGCQEKGVCIINEEIFLSQENAYVKILLAESGNKWYSGIEAEENKMSNNEEWFFISYKPDCTQEGYPSRHEAIKGALNILEQWCKNNRLTIELLNKLKQETAV